jgi:Flp pilus assembly protein TadG
MSRPGSDRHRLPVHAASGAWRPLPVHAVAARRQLERGSAVVELVLLGLPLLAPLVYLAVVLSSAQQARAGVTEAARQAGRAYVTGTAATAPARARAAAGAALADRGVPASGLEIRYAAAGSGCATATPRPWPLRPGAVFAVCVTAAVDLPALPGGPRRLTGRFLVRAGDHRDFG